MEDQAAPPDGVAAPAFSELIRDWLDEGDRIDETAAATTAAAPPTTEGRFQRIALRLRPALDRYRLFVLAGLGLIPFALFTLTHHGVAAPALAVSTVSNVPGRAPVPPSAPEAVAAPSSAVPPSIPAVVSSPPAVALAHRHRSSRHRRQHPKHRSLARRGR
jgi:hypothetical protein